MASGVQTTVTELPESRVRVEASVPADEVQKRIEQTAKALGRELRIPGFRKGKVPPPVVIKRIGREAVLDEALRAALPAWYGDAIDAAGIEPVGDPQLDVGDPPAEGEPLNFTVEIGVRPTATLGEYKGLEVGRREPEIPEAAIEDSINTLRERFGKLETHDGPAEQGDFVVADLAGTIDGEELENATLRDELIEVGGGRLLTELDQGFQGMSAGEEATIDAVFPDDYHAEHLQGTPAQFAVTVKEVKRKQLPEVNDDFAADAAGFDTLDELRADIRTRLEEAETQQIESDFREAVLDAAVANATVDVPGALIHARAHEMLEQVLHSLSHRGISKEAYLQIAQKTEEEMAHEAEPDAERGLKREAVIAAIVEADGIEPTEEELLEALEHTAEHEKTTPAKLLERLRKSGRIEAVSRDLAQRKAIDMLAEAATPISVEQAKAKNLLWTPEREQPEAGDAGALWTPGS
jgi:trigger factor